MGAGPSLGKFFYGWCRVRPDVHVLVRIMFYKKWLIYEYVLGTCEYIRVLQLNCRCQGGRGKKFFLLPRNKRLIPNYIRCQLYTQNSCSLLVTHFQPLIASYQKVTRLALKRDGCSRKTEVPGNSSDAQQYISVLFLAHSGQTTNFLRWGPSGPQLKNSGDPSQGLGDPNHSIQVDNFTQFN